MIILTENNSPKKEAGSNPEWDLTWKEALGVLKVLSGRNDIRFYEIGHPFLLGDPLIAGLKISGNDLFIYGKQTGYIIFGDRVKRVIRKHIEARRLEKMTLLFFPYKELEFSWTS
jgi:hypothetical protein